MLSNHARIGILTMFFSSVLICPASGAEQPHPVPSFPLVHPWLDPDDQPLPFTNDRDVLEFLSAAEVVSTEQVGKGIGRTQRLLLEKDGLRMRAAFRTVRTIRQIPDLIDPSITHLHRDDGRFEVAAYALSRVLGLRLVPPTVLREINGKTGSLQAWVEKAIVEIERRERSASPPDEWYWMSQMLTMQLFDNLVANSDRHQGNLLIDPKWEIWLIDHTQAFRQWKRLHRPEAVQYCHRTVWELLQKLSRESVEACCSQVLSGGEIDALLERRDRLVAQIQDLIERSGAENVLFEGPVAFSEGDGFQAQ